jgi:membrane protease YdiL (CAAX protease family)
MAVAKNTKIILASLGVPVLFSASLMGVVLLSISPFFLGVNERFTYGLAGSLFALLIIYGLLNVEQKTWKDYFLVMDRGTLMKFVRGALVGCVLASVMILLQASYSGWRLGLDLSHLRAFIWMSLSLIPLAFMEELAFRSYPFIKLKEAFGVWVAQITIALLFALYHYVGGWSLYASLIGPGVWSFAFGWLALRYQGISLPTGFHFGLNLVLAAVGNKYWVPALFTIEMKSVPSEKMLAANEYFGGAMQLIILIVFIVLTNRYTQKFDGQN